MRLAYWALLLPPLFWAGNFVLGRAMSEQIPPISLAFWRWLLAALILLPFTVKPIWNERLIIKQHIVALIALSVTGISIHNTLVYIGLQTTLVTNGTLLNSFIPIFIIVLSRLFFHTKTSRLQLMGIVISLTGVILTLSELSLQKLFALSFNQGDIWILIAGLDWALYSVLLKYYKPQQLSNLSFLGISIIIGCLCLLPIYLWNPFNEASIQFNNEVLISLAYIALFPSVIAFFAWNYGIATVGANIGGQFIHLLPVFGAIMATIFLDESLQSYHFAGAILIGIGLFLSLNFMQRENCHESAN